MVSILTYVNSEYGSLKSVLLATLDLVDVKPSLAVRLSHAPDHLTSPKEEKEWKIKRVRAHVGLNTTNISRNWQNLKSYSMRLVPLPNTHLDMAANNSGIALSLLMSKSILSSAVIGMSNINLYIFISLFLPRYELW